MKYVRVIRMSRASTVDLAKPKEDETHVWDHCEQQGVDLSSLLTQVAVSVSREHILKKLIFFDREVLILVHKRMRRALAD